MSAWALPIPSSAVLRNSRYGCWCRLFLELILLGIGDCRLMRRGDLRPLRCGVRWLGRNLGRLNLIRGRHILR